MYFLNEKETQLGGGWWDVVWAWLMTLDVRRRGPREIVENLLFSGREDLAGLLYDLWRPAYFKLAILGPNTEAFFLKTREQSGKIISFQRQDERK